MRKKTRKEIAVAALRKRLGDIFLGATGEEYDEEGYDTLFQGGAEGFPRFYNAVIGVFRLMQEADKPYHDRHWLSRPWNLDKFGNLDKLAEELYDAGVRA